MRKARHGWSAKRIASISMACLVVVAFAGIGHTDDSSSPQPQATVAARLRAQFDALGLADVPDHVIATLSSVRKIDEYPVYTMHYVGPYVDSDELLGTTASAESVAWGCSLFSAVGDGNEPVFGRNFDWDYSPLLVVLLEPEEGYRSMMSIDIAYLVDEGVIDCLETASAEDLAPLLDAPFLTFDGMNENGLAIGMASVEYECGYPTNPENRDVGDLRLMREVLESAGTVDEAVELLEGINPVSQGGPNTHYLIADRTSAAALVEYHDGEMYVFRSDAATPWLVGTNFPVNRTGGSPSGHCWRYDLIQRRLQESDGNLSVEDAMGLLIDAAMPMMPWGVTTRWSIVYDLAELEMHLAIEKDLENMHTFSFEETW